MGLFSDISDVIGEFKSLGNEVNNVGKDMVGLGHQVKEEAIDSANQIRQTVVDTAVGLRDSTGKILPAMNESVELAPDTTIAAVENTEAPHLENH